MDNPIPELLAPAGDWITLSAALRAGADAVYLGVGHLQMRSRSARGFERGDLRRAVRIAHAAGVRLYVTLNCLIYDRELIEMEQTLDAIAEAQADAVIAWDPAVLDGARLRGLPVHLSVQAGVSNRAALTFYSRYADAVVLARELDLSAVGAIVNDLKARPLFGPSGRPVRIEIFIHGAMCIAVSGRCGLSLATDPGFRRGVSDHDVSSGNRGNCLQICRRRFRLLHDETGQELAIENGHVLSPADLCTLPVLDRIVASGVQILKIEGRGRSGDYVATVTARYREALDRIHNGSFDPDWARDQEEKLACVLNHGFWRGGYYLGEETGAWAGRQNSQARQRRVFLGRIGNWYRHHTVAELQLQNDRLRQGDEILIEGPTTGSLRCRPETFLEDGREVCEATKGQIVTFIVPRKVRRADRVYRLEAREPDRDRYQSPRS